MASIGSQIQVYHQVDTTPSLTSTHTLVTPALGCVHPREEKGAQVGEKKALLQQGSVLTKWGAEQEQPGGPQPEALTRSRCRRLSVRGAATFHVRPRVATPREGYLSIPGAAFPKLVTCHLILLWCLLWQSTFSL